MKPLLEYYQRKMIRITDLLSEYDSDEYYNNTLTKEDSENFIRLTAKYYCFKETIADIVHMIDRNSLK